MYFQRVFIIRRGGAGVDGNLTSVRTPTCRPDLLLWIKTGRPYLPPPVGPRWQVAQGTGSADTGFPVAWPCYCEQDEQRLSGIRGKRRL